MNPMPNDHFDACVHCDSSDRFITRSANHDAVLPAASFST